MELRNKLNCIGFQSQFTFIYEQDMVELFESRISWSGAMHRAFVLAALFVAISCSAQTGFFGDETEESVSAAPIMVRVPEIPDELTFAGERVPLEYPDIRQAVQREILTTSNMHTATTLTLIRSARWIPVITPILKKYGIPEDFVYLCFAESGMNPEAVSPAKAAGLWQFLASAAKQYGMETGANIDMRYNIESATAAACKYLKHSYDSLGSWTLTAASYNCGLAGVKRRMNSQKVKSYWDLNLPEETMRYVPRILSFKILLSNPSKYGFFIDEDDYFKPFRNYTEVKVSSLKIDWCTFAKEHGTNFRILKMLNPWIRSYEYENKAGKTYTVKVPNKDFRKTGY